MARLPEEAQEVIWSQPHGGAVGHGVEVDHLVTPLQQVPVQDAGHAALLIEEQSESRGTTLTHLDRRRPIRAQEAEHENYNQELRRASRD